MTNRIHGKRWPVDPNERWALADTDIKFVIALSRCGIDRDTPQLNRIVIVASTQIMKAKAELKGKQ